jgi:hypothetical protein
MAIKSSADDFKGRFREVLSDPLNILIARDPRSGIVDPSGYVFLHNGIKAPITGANRYYGDFSDILIYNRGVHEPLEEFIFQVTLDHLPAKPVMLELGAYWGHYSMWLKKAKPSSQVFLVEPDTNNMNVGIDNFSLNNLHGTFFNDFVGAGHLAVDDLVKQVIKERIDILHADIQGHEVEMLDGCVEIMSQRLVDYVFVSTHSQQLHQQTIERLQQKGYRIEISSDFDEETTSYDGIVFASSPLKKPIFSGFQPLGRIQILNSTCSEVLNYISTTAGLFAKR